jgi:hypothetical protein
MQLGAGNLFLIARLTSVLVASLFLVACSSQEKTAPDPVLLLQAIPAANATKYQGVRDMKNWRNPYLVIRADGVGLLDTAENAEILLKPDEVLAALAHLPASAWPYGRVVAVSENGVRSSEQDRIAIRRNKGIVGGILAGAHLEVDWVPSA